MYKFLYIYKQKKRKHIQQTTRIKCPQKRSSLNTYKSSPVSKEKIKRIQGIVVSILFYARSIDLTFLVGLNSIAMQQTNATENSLKRTEDLLDYAATHPEAKI